jgi:hypothetical protein
VKTVTLESSAATRVGQLIRLLNSDKSGEVLGAARAINRTLESAGADIHDLADIVEHGLLQPQLPPPAPDLAEVARRELSDMLEYCRSRGEKLNERELAFIAKMLFYLRRDGMNFKMSERQLAWLVGIFDRLRAAT